MKIGKGRPGRWRCFEHRNTSYDPAASEVSPPAPAAPEPAPAPLPALKSDLFDA